MCRAMRRGPGYSLGIQPQNCRRSRKVHSQTTQNSDYFVMCMRIRVPRFAIECKVVAAKPSYNSSREAGWDPHVLNYPRLRYGLLDSVIVLLFAYWKLCYPRASRECLKAWLHLQVEKKIVIVRSTYVPWIKQMIESTIKNPHLTCAEMIGITARFYASFKVSILVPRVHNSRLKRSCSARSLMNQTLFFQNAHARGKIRCSRDCACSRQVHATSATNLPPRILDDQWRTQGGAQGARAPPSGIELESVAREAIHTVNWSTTC